MNLLTFQEALDDANGKPGFCHLLLGNGFSIACRSDCFNYGALLDEADFSQSSVDLHAIFEILGTVDFEKVIQALGFAAALIDRYGVDPAVSARLIGDAEVIKDALARVLAAKHPDVPFDITLDEYAAARAFLLPFKRIYTINYDMLLYWTLMQDMDPYLERNDGFGNPDDAGADYVVWQPYELTTNQRIFFLHGGLHLYDNGDELAKVTFSRTQVPLVDQIRAALDQGRFPLVVTEGTSREKSAAIQHHAYLTHASRSFSGIGGKLFLYGLSLAPNDEHILRHVEDGKVTDLYISFFGDPKSETNVAIERRAQLLAAARDHGRPLAIHFYDAASARVWG